MQDEQALRCYGELGIRSALVVAELYLVGTVEEFHDCANLAAHKTVIWYVLEQGDNVE